MHYRNVEGFLKPFLNGEALWSLYILKVYSAKGRGYLLHGLTELLRVLLVYFNIENIYSSVNLEQETLSLHDRLTAHGSDVSQTENGRTIADYGNKVSLVSIFINVVGVLLNFQTRISYTRRIGQTKVGLCLIRLGWFYFDFTWSTVMVICQGCLFRYLYHIFPFFCYNRSLYIYPNAKLRKITHKPTF